MRVCIIEISSVSVSPAAWSKIAMRLLCQPLEAGQVREYNYYLKSTLLLRNIITEFWKLSNVSLCPLLYKAETRWSYLEILSHSVPRSQEWTVSCLLVLVFCHRPRLRFWLWRSCSTEPVEFKPQKTPSQESLEADHTQLPPEHLED